MAITESLDTVLDNLLTAYTEKPFTHNDYVHMVKERERLRQQFLTMVLRTAGVVVKG